MSIARSGAATRALIDSCWIDGGTIYLSAVTVWAIALLVDGGKVQLDVTPHQWVERFLARPSLEAAPLGWREAGGAYGLEGFRHCDPADRLLIATAIELGRSLVIYDARIAEFGAGHGERQGFATVAGD